MKISEMAEGAMLHTQLSTRVLAVLVKRIDGWCVYVDAVPGQRHEQEWLEVATSGQKQREPIAKAIAEHLFHPGFEIDEPYAV